MLILRTDKKVNDLLACIDIMNALDEVLDSLGVGLSYGVTLSVEGCTRQGYNKRRVWRWSGYI